MELNPIVACICEGGAERAILEILLENDLLIFNELLDDKIIMERTARDFQNKYLGKSFKERITLFRILDSRKENFRLTHPYKNKVDVINLVTAPEIEILIILSENKYEDYKQTKLKPNEYCKTKLKYAQVKNYQFIRDYFSEIGKLKTAIYEYNRLAQRKAPKGEYNLYDIIKPF